MTADEARKLALSLPEAVEQDHHGRASFRVGGKIFATMPPDGAALNVMLGEEEARAAADEAAGVVELLWWGRRLSGVQIALFLLGEATVIVNRSILWIELDGAIVVRDRPI